MIREGLHPNNATTVEGVALSDRTWSAGVRRSRAGLVIVALAAMAMLALTEGSAAAATIVPELPALNQEGFGDACGSATDSKGDLYVADYLANTIKVFGPAGGAAITEFTPSANAEKPCSLAVDSAGNVYATGWGTDVVKYKPSAFPPSGSTTYAPDTAIDGTGTLVPGSSHATAVAVDPSDDHVFVAEEGTHVSEYSPAGALVTALIGESVPGISSPAYYGVDVSGKTGNVYLTDLANDRAYVLNPAGDELLAEIDGTDTPSGAFEFEPFVGFSFLAVDQSTGNVLVSDIRAHGVVDEFDEDGNYLTTISHSPAFTDGEPSDIAVDNGAQSPNKGNVYVTTPGNVFAFGPLPAASVLEVLKAGGGSGHVTSEPAGIDCGAFCAAPFPAEEEITLTPVADPGSRFKSWSGCQSVPGELCKISLAPETTAAVTATFVSAKPTAVSLDASQITATGARLEAEVNPDGAATTYQFEYLTESAYQANGESFSGPQAAAKVPASPASIGGGFQAVSATELIGGLDSETTYRYRVRATNSSGSAESATGSFVTRVAQGSGLPDGRAYEQASPVDKNGGTLQAFSTASTRASINGDAITFESAAGIPGGEGSQEFPTYLARRSVNPQSGEASWITQGLLPPASRADSGQILGWTPDFAEVFDGGAARGGGAELLARSSEDGQLTTVAESDSYDTKFFYSGSSADRQTVLFEANQAPVSLNEEGPTPAEKAVNLYAWDRVGGEVRLAGVLPDGSAPAKGSVAGLTGNSGYTQVQPAVMADGSVYFTVGGQTYLRQRPTAPETSQRDTDGNCISTPGLACTIHIADSEKTNGSGPDGTDAAGTQPAEFLAASTSTSKAFFTSSEKLTDDATTGPEPALAAIVRAKLGASAAEDVEEGFLPAHAAGITMHGNLIYWADPTTGSIGRAKLNGDGSASDVEAEFLAVGGNPRWVAVDDTYAYWSDPGDNEPGGGTIGRARLDGGEAPEPEFITDATKPQGVAVNATHVYWANNGTSATAAIGRANLNGSAASSSWLELGGFEKPQGVVLDGSHLYLTTFNSSSAFLQKTNLDGTERKVAFLGANTTEPRGIALDQDHLYWISQGNNKIGRANLDLTGLEPDYVTGIQKSTGLVVDATHLYWSANGETLPNPGKDLYRYDAEAPAGERLTDLTVDNNPADTCTGEVLCGAQVQGVLGASADGSAVYYVANGVPDGPIANSPNANGESAEAGDCRGSVVAMTGECNLYLWRANGNGGSTIFIARLDPSGGFRGDVTNWITDPGPFGGFTLFVTRTARVSPDGRTLLFRSKRNLSGYDSEGVGQLYRFEAADASTLCISCDPSGAAPAGIANIGSIFPAVGGAALPVSTLSRNLATGGNRVFFESTASLVAADRNGDRSCEPWGSSIQKSFIRACQDVYEWEAKGTGSCKSEAQNGGCLYLLSTGKGDEPAFFADASGSGDDVFIFSANQLVPQDRDGLIDVYDVRVGGGIPGQSAQAPIQCSGEPCRSQAPPTPASQAPGSSSFSGPGNEQSPRPHKKKKKHHKKKHKHHKKKHKHHKQTKQKKASETGRTSR